MNNKVKIIQANLSELKELYFISDNFSPDELFYLTTMIYYYQGDISQLQSYLLDNKMNSYLDLMGKIRLNIIEQNINQRDLENLQSYLENNPKLASEWIAEAWFLLGWAHREIQSNIIAKKIFKKCYSILWQVQAKKKAVKSMLNHVVCQSHIDPSKRYIIDFQTIAKKALEVGDPIVAGLCQLNIARDYRFLGSYELSEKLINQSVANLELDRGANNYYFAVLERCYLNIELKRFKLAHLDYQIVSESPLLEIKEASKLILKILGGDVKIESKALDPVWGDVLKDKELKSSYKLTKTESSLINYLSLGEKSKVEIIKHLYGNQLNFDSAENRLKVLLSRLKKKAPELITYHHGFYTINEGKVLNTDQNLEVS